jgi:hypothetical protein
MPFPGENKEIDKKAVYDSEFYLLFVKIGCKLSW